MGTMQFLATLPAILGITGFVAFLFIKRNGSGDRITLDIVNKLRQDAPEQLPKNSDRLGPAELTRLIEGNATLRSKISEQDFYLLRDALRHQFITSLTVYTITGLMFLAGVALYTYISVRPIPVSLTSISTESTAEAAGGIMVDLYPLRIGWSSSGDPEDVTVSLENLETHRRTTAKTVRSTEGTVVFYVSDYQSLLKDRSHGGNNRIRAILQSSKAAFVSTEMSVLVGTTILAVLIEPNRMKIAGIIDNSAIPYYNFEAKFLVWASSLAQPARPVTYGGQIKYGQNDFYLDKSLQYDWSTKKLVYFGPDDPNTIKIEYLGF